MQCPKCNSERKVKDGIVKQKQRYLCRDCNYRFTVESRGKPNSLKKMAIELYLEGMGFRSIERILKVSNVSVMKWVKSLGEKVEEYRKPEGDVDIIEMDELYTYIQSKKNLVGFGWLLIELNENSSAACLVQEEPKQEKSFTNK